MKFCAVLYGHSDQHVRTQVTLDKFSDLSVVRFDDLPDTLFSELDSDYTLFIRDGDTLSILTRERLEIQINWKQPDIIYSDEALMFKGGGVFNFYKPDYSPELLLSYNYFGNLLCIKTDLLRQIVKINSENYSNFLYEIVLKALPKAKVVAHVDEVLYTSYTTVSSVGYHSYFVDFDQKAGQKLLEEYCSDNQIDATIHNARYHGTYRFQYECKKQPLVSIIIPFRDKPELLNVCVNSILEKTIYQNFEIIGVDNGSVEKSTLDLMESLEKKDDRIHFHTLNVPYNYAAINNTAANDFAKGEQLLFLNNDTEVIEPTWVEAMLEHSQRPEVGVVGAKLLFSNNTLQHAGILLGHLVSHSHLHMHDSLSGYFYFPHVTRNYHGMTFACVMLKADLFQKMGGLYEVLAIAYNDVDICARLSAEGYYNVYTPYAVLYHHESKSRGYEDTEWKQRRSYWERSIAISRTPDFFARDHFYNRNLTVHGLDFAEKLWTPRSRFLFAFKKLIRIFDRDGILETLRKVMRKMKRRALTFSLRTIFLSPFQRCLKVYKRDGLFVMMKKVAKRVRQRLLG
jgi:GT2 family glycosyltransferase